MPNLTPNFDTTSDAVLFHGDCRALLRDLPDGLVNLVITSPPYNIGKSYERKVNLDQYLQQQREVIQQCARVLGPRGSLCWQVGNYLKEDGEIIPLDIVLYPLFKALGLKLRNRIVWHFEHGLHSRKRFSGRYEVILWFTKTDDYVLNMDDVRVPQKYPYKKYFKGPKKGQYSGHPLGKNPGDVWLIPNVKANHVEKTSHPCQFPVELIERLVLALTNAGDWVLDPFMGTGTSVIAALMHERKAMGAEIAAEYIEIAKQRFSMGEAGTLRVRPLQRPVYDPADPSNGLPPAFVHLNSPSAQPNLLEKRSRYGKRLSS